MNVINCCLFCIIAIFIGWFSLWVNKHILYYSPLKCPEHNKTIVCVCYDENTKMYISYICATTDETMYSQWNEFVIKYKVVRWYYTKNSKL